MKANLTDGLIKSHLPAPDRIEIVDTKVPGLWVRLHGNSFRWSFVGRIAGSGKRERVALDVLAVKDARAASLDIRAKHRRGESHNVAIAASIAKRRTLASLAADYIAQFDPSRSATYRRTEATYVKTAMADMGAEDFAPTDLAASHVLALRGKHIDHPHTAKQMIGALSRFLDWLALHELVSLNAAGLVARAKPVSIGEGRTRVLTAPEIKAIWEGSEEIAEAYGSLLRFLMLVPLRRAEGAGLRREWIKGDVLRLPGMMAKNGDDFEIPLPPAAMDIINARPEGEMLFGTAKGLSKAVVRLRDRLDLPHWTTHDFRRSFASGLAEAGVPDAVADGLLNHRQSATRSGVMGVYNKASQKPQKQRAMALWARMVESAVKTGTFKPEDTKVVAIR